MRRKCNHDITSKKTSIAILPEEFMVYPPQKVGFCPVCQRVFNFTVQDDNSLILVEEDQTNADE